MPPPKLKVGVDWHNTVEIRGQVPPANILALQRLVDAGVAVYMLSYIGKDNSQRRREYYNQALALPMVSKFDRVTDCTAKTGPDGKVALYRSWRVKALFDDNKDVCWEGMNSGIQVFPITTPHEDHQWFFHEGFRPFRTFADAVGYYLTQRRM